MGCLFYGPFSCGIIYLQQSICNVNHNSAAAPGGKVKKTAGIGCAVKMAPVCMAYGKEIEGHE